MPLAYAPKLTLSLVITAQRRVKSVLGTGAGHRAMQAEQMVELNRKQSPCNFGDLEAAEEHSYLLLSDRAGMPRGR
jgi:hypothetical protein